MEWWKKKNVLVSWNDKIEDIIPLMANEKLMKNIVRTVLDFCELNKFVKWYTTDDVIFFLMKTLWEWRQRSADVSIFELVSVYLQIKVDKRI